MADLDAPKRRICDALADADAVVGNSAYLTSDQLVEHADVSAASIDGHLRALRFGERLVAKGPDDQWRLVDDDAYGVES